MTGWSKGKKRRPLTDTEKARLSVLLTGEKKSEEWKKLMSIKMSGKTIPEEVRQKIRASLTGRKHTDEHKRHISEGGKGKQVGHPNYTGHNYPFGLSGLRPDLGFRVRSRFEANFARILMYDQICFEYEIDRFILRDKDGNPVRSYCPDFYICDADLYVETKGWWRDEDAETHQMFSEQYPDIVLLILFEDSDMWRQFTAIYKRMIPEWEDSNKPGTKTRGQNQYDTVTS